MASVGSRVTRLERRGVGMGDEARTALAKLAAGTPLDDITDNELRAIAAAHGRHLPDFSAMSDDERAVYRALQRHLRGDGRYTIDDRH